VNEPQDAQVWPDVAVPPGEFLLEEIQARGLKPSALAQSLAVSPRRFRDILAGRKPISADVALALESELGVDAQFWMNLQVDYDLTVARLARPRVS